jgi:hypothetical protein
MSDLQRELGRLDERTTNHADRLQRIEEKLDHIVSAIDSAKGGWKALVAAGAIASVITATIMKLIGSIYGALR